MAGCTFPKACRQNKDLATFSLFSHCSEMWKQTPNIEGTTSPQLWKLKVKKDKYICTNWISCATVIQLARVSVKLQQMPPQPPAAEVTLQCMGSWFSPIGCPLQNTKLQHFSVLLLLQSFCNFSRPPLDESTWLIVHCRTQIAALLWPSAPSVILIRRIHSSMGLPTHTEVATLGFLLV